MSLRSSIVALIFVVLTALVITALYVFRPRIEETKKNTLPTPVYVQIAKPISRAIEIGSQGVLEARTQTTAAAEVTGKVISVADQFEAGGEFQQGDLLLEIDPADYVAAVAQAESGVAEAQLAVEVETAKAEQSVRDWKKLGRNQAPSALVLREPQLASAKARLDATKASLAKARRDLQRTKLLAPYDGRVLRTHTDLASFVAVGAPLADFYQNDQLEIRLPVSLEEYGFLDLAGEAGTQVELFTKMAGDLRSWRATLVRQDAEVDRRSRSMHLIAAVDLRSVDDPLLVPGLFVSAKIQGKTLPDVFELPRSALVGSDRLRIVTPESTLIERRVTVAHAEANTILVSAGLEPLDQVCLSPVPRFINDMEVEVKGKAKESDPN